MHTLPATRRTACQRTAAGFSVVEAMVAVAIIGIALGAMMTLNGTQLRMVKMSRDTNAATLYQQERVEQLRQARWPDLTSKTYIASNYMADRPASKAALNEISESITVTAYPSAANGGTTLKVSQQPGANPVVDSSLNGFGLVNERLVKVEMTLGWKAADGRLKQRSTSTLISNSGVTRSNLPALGPVSGGAWTPYGSATGSTTGGTDTGGTTGGTDTGTGGTTTGGTTTGGTTTGGTTTGGTDTGGTTTGGTTTGGTTTGGTTTGGTTTGNGNGNGGVGNGNGRGNTGGKPGKG